MTSSPRMIMVLRMIMIVRKTQWIAFLTIIIFLRTDRSLLSTLDSRLGFPPLLWTPFPWPSGCPVISEEMARYKVEREEKTEQGRGQPHAFHVCTLPNPILAFEGDSSCSSEGRGARNGLPLCITIEVHTSVLDIICSPAVEL